MIAAVCDDNAVTRKEITDFLAEYKKSRRIQLDVVEFSDGNELLEYQYPFDVVFMDYEMPNLDGLSTSRRLREKKSTCCIIFVSSYSEHVFESFEVSTYRYIVKPIDYRKLEIDLDAFIKEKTLHLPITVNFGGEQKTINSEDIVYLEADDKYCNIRTAKDYVRSSKTLSGVLDLLPRHCFYRVHKSYAVNLCRISLIRDNFIILSTGEKVKISRKTVADLKNAYKEFLKHFIMRG